MSENTTPAVPPPEGRMRTRDRDELAEVLRCPGCGSAIDPNRNTCYPLKVDVTQPGYRYLEGIWGYCLTLSRDVRLGEDWLVQRDRRVAAEAVEKVAREWQFGGWTILTAPPPTGSIHALAHGQRVTDWLRERADRIEAGDR